MDSEETKNTAEPEQAAGSEPATTTEEQEPKQEEPKEEKEEKVPYELIEKHPHEGSVLHIKVSVAREAFEAKMEEMLKELKSSVAIEGFRKGKAPRKLLEIRYGKEVKEDAVKALANNVGEQLIENEKLELVTEGDLHAWTADEGKPLEMTLEFEVRPSVEIQGYEGLEVEVEEQTVNEEMVDRRLEQLRESNAQFKSAGEGAKFNPGDGAVVDIEMLDEHGHMLERQSAENQFVRDLAAAVPKELADKLPGLGVGETIEAQIQSPHTTRQGQQRVATDTQRLTLREIKIRELPALDDDFAEDLGEFNTIGELRDRVRKDLQARAEQIMREQALVKIHEKILEANPFDAPRSIVAASTVSMVREQSQRLAYAGINLGSLGEEGQKRYIEATRIDAEKTVKRELALASIARQEKLEVSEEDLNQAIEQMAESEGRRPLAIRARLEREKRLDDVKSDLLLNKVNDLILSKSKINKVAPAPAAAAETEQQ